MRIVDRKTFLAMPANTIYAKYDRGSFESIEIKGDSLTDDFFSQEIISAIECSDSGDFFDVLDASEHEGKSIAMNFNCEYRDGCFDAHQFFAVFEAKDVEALIERLQKCLPNEV